MDIYCDFNSQGHYKLSLEKEQIKDQLLLNIRSCLSHLLPRGVFHGDKFYVGDVRGNKGKSMVVELTGSKAGIWHDFATGEGGDIFDLWAAVAGKSQFTDTIEDIAKWIGYSDQNKILEQPTLSWNYYDENDEIIATVYRYDSDSGKRYLPFDVKKSSFTAPEVRPLYNIPGILKSDKVILVEGEKCAESLIEQGITATTAMCGANATLDKTDWSPLKSKHVVVWPDNDRPGKQYAEKVVNKLTSLSMSSLAILEIPEDKPKGWDAADCIQDNIDIPDFIKNNSRKIIIKQILNIRDWSVARFVGQVPEQKFLVEGLFPLGVTSILAAMGDTGKGMLLLDLALKIASEVDQPCGFGPLVTEHGSVVIFSAEDDASEIHRRLERLDPQCERLKYKDRLFIIPLPNAGGPFAILRSIRGKAPEILPKFEDICKQLNSIENLKLIVFDPLISFVHADINSDPEMGGYITGLFANLASETGAAVIAAHHMRKPKGNGLITADQAREAIRGTSALVDGVRCSFALWPASSEHQNFVFSTLKLSKVNNAVYQGAIVKSNAQADRSIKTYLRCSQTGLLEDISEQLIINKHSEESLKMMLIEAIELSAQEGHPFTHTGGPGVYKNRHRLPSVFHEISKHRIGRLVQSLLNEGKIVKGMASHSKEDKWLDVPNGPFAKGHGEFKLGAAVDIAC